MNVCENSKFVHDNYIIISNHVTEAKITVHIGFLNWRPTVTTDDDVSS